MLLYEERCLVLSSSRPASITGTCRTGEIKCTPCAFEAKAVKSVRQFEFCLRMPDDTSLTHRQTIDR